MTSNDYSATDGRADAPPDVADDNTAPVSNRERLDRMIRRLLAVAPARAEDDLFDIKADVPDDYGDEPHSD